MWLLSRWIVRALAAPEFFDSYEAIGLIATGVTLYALYLVLVVILGRTGRTEFNFPATIAALVANVALNLVLVPPLGIVGAGLALVASYLVVLALMYVFTQRLFPVPYEWGRLARVVLAVGGPGRRSASCCCRPTGAAGLLLARLRSGSPTRCALLASGFFTAEERGWLALPPPPAASCSPRSRAAARAAGRGRRAASPRSTRPSRMDEDSRPERCAPVERAALAQPFAAVREERLAGVGPGRPGPGGRAGRWRRAPAARRPRRSAARTASAAAATVVLAHVEVAVAVELDDPRQSGRRGRSRAGRGGRPGGGDEEGVPAGVGRRLAKSHSS